MPDLPTDLAAAQHGLLTTEQLRVAGLSPKQISRSITYGKLVRLSPRVLCVAGAPETTPRRLLAAVLDTGADSVLSHSTALAWWGLPGFLHDEIHVSHTRDRPPRRCSLASHVHDLVEPPEHHVRMLELVPVTTPARALFDIAGQRGISAQRVERAVDNAWSRRLVSGASLRRMLKELAKRGRPGIRVMREILEARGPDYIPPASGLESRVVQLLKDAGHRPLRRQVDCGDDREWIGRVDFADGELPFILEVQSERFHTSVLDRKADQNRIARLRAAGYVVTTVTDTDVWHRPANVLDLIRDGRQKARTRCLLPRPAA